MSMYTAATRGSRKRWSCNNRDCDWVQQPHTVAPPVEVIEKFSGPVKRGNSSRVCPKCGHVGMDKRWVKETVPEGKETA